VLKILSNPYKFFSEQPLPQFTLLLPLTGWFLDGSAAILHIQEIVYSSSHPVIHTLLLAVGLYLEVSSLPDYSMPY